MYQLRISILLDDRQFEWIDDLQFKGLIYHFVNLRHQIAPTATIFMTKIMIRLYNTKLHGWAFTFILSFKLVPYI